jgi:hypothetical protein
VLDTSTLLVKKPGKGTATSSLAISSRGQLVSMYTTTGSVQLNDVVTRS